MAKLRKLAGVDVSTSAAVQAKLDRVLAAASESGAARWRNLDAIQDPALKRSAAVK